MDSLTLDYGTLNQEQDSGFPLLHGVKAELYLFSVTKYHNDTVSVVCLFLYEGLVVNQPRH